MEKVNYIITFDNELRFEGEFINGEVNGKGKVYCKGKLRFEGELLGKHKINGITYKEKDIFKEKLKETGLISDYYYFIEREKFEPEYLKGKLKEYNKYRELKFEGEYLNGKKHGKGTEFYLDWNVL